MAVLGTLGTMVSFGLHMSVEIELNEGSEVRSWATVLVLLVNVVSWLAITTIILALRAQVAER